MNKVDAFYKLNPIVSFAYFVSVLILTMLWFNPILLLISLVCAVSYGLLTAGKRLRQSLKYAVILAVFTAVLNPLFNHNGQTVIAYFSNGNPLTLESILFGMCEGVMLICVICWFSCFNVIVTSDKIAYLFGRAVPKISMLFTMSMRFFPKLLNEGKSIINAQTAIGKSVYQGSIADRVKNMASVLNVLVNRTLEESVDTADSMYARGYATVKRTAFSVFEFTYRDTVCLVVILMLLTAVLLSKAFGIIDFVYFPCVYTSIGIFSYIEYTLYAILCAIPIIIDFTEAIIWKRR